VNEETEQGEGSAQAGQTGEVYEPFPFRKRTLRKAAHAFLSNTTKATEPIEPDGLCRLEVRAPAGICTDRCVSRSWQYVQPAWVTEAGVRSLKARTPVHYAKTGGHLL
jgi:hypothetical protein